MTLHVRAERPTNAVRINALTIAAFRDAAHRDGTEQHIVAALRRRGDLAVSWVAEARNELIGHVAISPVSISDGAAGWYGLGPLSVAPAHQRQGVGTRLMEAALMVLRERAARGCVVLGDPAYYGRFGFRAEARLVLPGVPPEYFQALCLALPLPVGSVTYSTAFGLADA
jgi:putative acetyltransferase